MNKFAIGLSLAALTLAASAVTAQAGPAARGDWANKSMTRADVQARAALLFDKLDANHDGKLDSADRAAQRSAMFDRIDTDHNGAISRGEFDAMHRPGAMRGRGMAGMDHGDMKPGGMGRHGMKAHRMGGRGMAGRMADINGDGTVSRDEFLAGALKRFETADTNHDGTTTPAERQAAHAMMKARWHGRDGATPPPGT